MSDIQLNFINRSNDQNNSQIVIFQKNSVSSYNTPTVAWKVIENCDRGDHHPFTYPAATQIAVADPKGKLSPTLNAEEGQAYHMVNEKSSNELLLKGPSTSPNETAIMNDLPKGSINANIYKDGKLLYTIPTIDPAQGAAFNFKPILYIGVANGVTEGKPMDPSVFSEFDTELNIEGIISADLVMTGGGSGPVAEPFQFSLKNVN